MRGLRPIAFFLLVAVVAACGGGGSSNPILRLSAEEALTTGKQYMEQKKWYRAREYLLHAFEVEPNSATGREALLLVADSHYEAGGTQNFIKAEAKYRDFQNRFPTSNRAAYVQFQVANSLSKRMQRADRDQDATYRALQSFETLLRLYPTSEYIAESQAQIGVLRNNLAKSEYLKGYFYTRSVRLPHAAVSRFERLLEEYPDYDEMDKVLFYLGRAYDRMQQTEKAHDAWARLKSEYPDSPLTRKIPKRQAEVG